MASAQKQNTGGSSGTEQGGKVADHSPVYTFHVLPLFDSPTPHTLAEQVSGALLDGGMVIAASARSARFLHLVYAEQQRAAGHEMWTSPQIYDWETWVTNLWRELTFTVPESPLLLTPLQEHSLWKQVQRSDARLVVSPDGMASLAQEAYKLLSAYRMQDTLKSPWAEPDAERFRQWAAEFDRLCNSRDWTSRSLLEDLLSGAIRAGHLSPAKRILLVGFDRLTPQQERFIAILREAGAVVESAVSEAADTCAGILVRADDLHDELHACAQWCRSRLEDDPSQRIGIIAPDVRSIRAEADRIFRAVLTPENLEIAKNPGPPVYEFSLGVPLADVPVIRAALLMLRWLTGPLKEEELTWLMLSGFFCKHPGEVPRLAETDFRLRDAKTLSPEMSLDTFASKTRTGPFRTRLLHLQRIFQKQQALPSATYTHWANTTDQMLRAGRWPGFRQPDSIQYQAQARWQRLLDEVALLDFSRHEVAYKEFVKAVEQHAAETIFTPESRNAPVQIMGAFESSGQTFDAVWFLGVDDSQWPGSGRPHPLLPQFLQVKAQMPHSSASIDTDLALLVTQRIATSAPEFVLSYARQNKEGDLRVSPVLARIFGATLNSLTTHDLRSQLHAPEPALATPRLESLVTSSEVAPWPQDRSAAGANVLKEQAACPFQAFAMRRLHTKPLNRAEWGLSAMERGNLIHKILQHLWSPDTPEPMRMTSLDDLKRILSEGRLEEVLRHHISTAFLPLVQENTDDPWMSAYLESEQNRMFVRLREWMHCEAQRQPFKVEKREEKLQNVRVGELKLELRADRIDLLPDQSRLLLDYKTGKVSPADWQGERMKEPQLPLYAIYGNVENVSGLLFAQIRARETGFVGRISDARAHLKSDLPGTSPLVNQPYNDEMKEDWQNALLYLAHEFLRGEASVAPRDGQKTCKLCPLPGLCRVAETEVDADGEDDDE
ncbi:MAG TPA: PD-(D/E)XK nuclease family protein [Alloacidobacterium sp.]|nr:PD-(D/E)XK nuclease family protein [Alloacidobacterium sp.]